MAHNFLQSVRLLSAGMDSFEQYCIRGLEAQREHIADLLGRSLMLVTALVPHIGYDRAAEIAKFAQRENLSLRDAALALKAVSAADFDRWVQPEHMV
jgi:fumarate hydratase class II